MHIRHVLLKTKSIRRAKPNAHVHDTQKHAKQEDAKRDASNERVETKSITDDSCKKRKRGLSLPEANVDARAMKKKLNSLSKDDEKASTLSIKSVKQRMDAERIKSTIVTLEDGGSAPISLKKIVKQLAKESREDADDIRSELLKKLKVFITPKGALSLTF
ncbi:hypothetical protein MVES1_000605 [Malassezia vespertilionis]|uniref:uncharacterized protein n=1 Tax=Malassezia vespertilionis TaxID=2020962 RepID=UPI0024B09890|nr:uncharacterized protein MVES1_000605 [Malassezia vespertilionis]WFD05276.1 hypothetical protein MVES1_000605 [Malassezia vespertilionis]